MKRTRKEMKAEAIERMKSFGLFNPVIRDFKRNDLIQLSEPPVGACFYLDPEMLEVVKELEKDGHFLVYHMIRNWTEFGELWSFLYVYYDDEDWTMDHEDAKEGYQMAYVWNKDGGFSDMGTIGIRRTIAGGLERTA